MSNNADSSAFNLAFCGSILDRFDGPLRNMVFEPWSIRVADWNKTVGQGQILQASAARPHIIRATGHLWQWTPTSILKHGLDRATAFARVYPSVPY